jgi:hypothetical protein
MAAVTARLKPRQTDHAGMFRTGKAAPAEAGFCKN